MKRAVFQFGLLLIGVARVVTSTEGENTISKHSKSI